MRKRWSDENNETKAYDKGRKKDRDEKKRRGENEAALFEMQKLRSPAPCIENNGRLEMSHDTWRMRTGSKTGTKRRDVDGEEKQRRDAMRDKKKGTNGKLERQQQGKVAKG